MVCWLEVTVCELIMLWKSCTHSIHFFIALFLLWTQGTDPERVESNSYFCNPQAHGLIILRLWGLRLPTTLLCIPPEDQFCHPEAFNSSSCHYEILFLTSWRAEAPSTTRKFSFYHLQATTLTSVISCRTQAQLLHMSFYNVRSA